MLPELKKNTDSSLTLFIQKDEPTDSVQKANWLPAPNGPIYTVLRMYWPRESVLNGSWEPPGIQAAKRNRVARSRRRYVLGCGPGSIETRSGFSLSRCTSRCGNEMTMPASSKRR